MSPAAISTGEEPPTYPQGAHVKRALNLFGIISKIATTFVVSCVPDCRPLFPHPHGEFSGIGATGTTSPTHFLKAVNIPESDRAHYGVRANGGVVPSRYLERLTK